MRFFSMNDYCYVRLTDVGRKELKRQHECDNAKFNGILGEFKPIVEDEQGWSEWQMHSLMSKLGALCIVGGDPPFETLMRFDVNEHHDG